MLLRPRIIPAVPVQAADPVMNHRRVAVRFADAHLVLQFLPEGQRLLGGAQRVRAVPQLPLQVGKLHHGAEGPGSVSLVFVRVMMRGIGRPELLRQRPLPLQGLPQVPLHALAGHVHVHKLVRGLIAGILRILRRGFDQIQRPFIVHLHVNAAQVGQADEKLMGGGSVVFLYADAVQRFQQRAVQHGTVVLVPHRGNLLVSLFQFLHVGPLVLCILLVHLHRDDFHILLFLFPVLRQRIFNFLHIVARLQQVRRNRQGKQAALVEGVPDRAVEVLPGHQVFVVPDRDIPELLVFMDQAHQPLRVAPVFFPVAQEHVRVKRVPHLRGQFIPDQHGFQEGVQHVLVGRRRRIGDVPVHQLHLGADFVEIPLQPRLHQDRQDRNMLFQRKGQLNLPGAVRLKQEPLRHPENHQLHIAEDPEQLLPVIVRFRFRIIPDGAGGMRQDLVCQRLEIRLPVRGMARKIYLRFSPGISHFGCFEFEFHRFLLPCCMNLFCVRVYHSIKRPCFLSPDIAGRRTTLICYGCIIVFLQFRFSRGKEPVLRVTQL